MADKEHSGIYAILLSAGFVFLLFHLGTAVWLFTQPGVLKGILPHEFLYKPTFLALDMIQESHPMNVSEQRLAFTVAGSVQFVLMGIAIDMILKATKVFSG